MPAKADSDWENRTSKAILLIRILVGWVFLSEGIQKFLFPDSLGVGRFVKIGIPWPRLMDSLRAIARAFLVPFMIHELFPFPTETAFGSHPRRVVSVTYRKLRPFHGGNTGSNPVGDANLINNLRNCWFWRTTGYATVELLNHSTMCVAFFFRHGFVVDIHRDCVRGMPQQALHYFGVVVVLAQQGRVGVA
jgi:hypothetical protein